MKEGNTIKDLISKFNLSSITDGELAGLMQYMHGDKPGSEMNTLYERIWEEDVDRFSHPKATEMYESVLKKTDLKAKIPGRNRNRFLFPVLKYAAIFILAFCISWVIQNQLKYNRVDPKNLVFQKVEVPYGSKTRLKLPDGSMVILNSGSSISYPNIFEPGSRTVYLKGEAFFDVKKDKSRPFYVDAAGIKVKVLGTTFNVKAYPEEKTVETTLVTGEVQIFTGKQMQMPDMVLKPSQKAIYRKDNNKILRLEEAIPEKVAIPSKSVAEIIKHSDIQTSAKISESIAWKDNQLVFDNEEFEELVAKIDRWFNVEITLNYPALKNARFSGKFDKETVEQALNAMILATPFRYSIQKNKITIYK